LEGSYTPLSKDISSPKRRDSLDDTIAYKSKKNLWKEIRDQEAFLAAEEVIREIKITGRRSKDQKSEQIITEIRKDDTPKI
jgi:hypothetical protein